MRLRTVIVSLALSGLAVALSGSVFAQPGAPTSLRITALKGAVVKLGSMDAHPLYGVRLRATVCLSSASAALTTYPNEIRITHFAVSKSRKTWWAARTTIDRAPWLVPLGETWRGRACGLVALEDAIPSQHYGVESLGNPNGCYGVGVTIKARGTLANRRTVVTCGRRFG